MIEIERSAWAAQPWKNGGGITHELWRDGDPFTLRVSLATVERDGPFSVFPGFRRHTFLVGPAPITLADAELRSVGDHVELPGERAISATLHAGPTALLNVLVGDTSVVGIGATAHPVRFVFDLAQQRAFVAATATRGCVWIA